MREAAVVWLLCGVFIGGWVFWKSQQPSPPPSVLSLFVPEQALSGFYAGMALMWLLLAWGAWQIAGVMEARQRAAEGRGSPSAR